jgi:uncharacterized protein (TIGR03437 family)
VQSTTSLAQSSATVPNNAASESGRAPFLPVELNGVSMSINGAACGLYSVSATAISFVVPIGMIPNSGTASYAVVINIRDDVAGTNKVVRGRIVIVAAQPDIFSTTNGPGGRAVVCNVTNPATPGCSGEPFKLKSDDGTGTLVPTVLEIHLTGVRGASAGSITATIGTTAIVASRNIKTDLPGFDQTYITLPATVDTGPNLTLVVTVGTASSRQTTTAPLIRIDP